VLCNRTVPLLLACCLAHLSEICEIASLERG
jgi:hypothetical protein